MLQQIARRKSALRHALSSAVAKKIRDIRDQRVELAGHQTECVTVVRKISKLLATHSAHAEGFFNERKSISECESCCPLTGLPLSLLCARAGSGPARDTVCSAAQRAECAQARQGGATAAHGGATKLRFIRDPAAVRQQRNGRPHPTWRTACTAWHVAHVPRGTWRMHRVARGAQVDERLDLLGSIGTLSMDGQPNEIDLALVPPVRVELSLKIADAGASIGAAPSSERAAAEAASSSAREEPKVSNLLKMEDVAALMSYDEVVAIKLKLTELVRDGYAKSYALTIIGNIQHTTHQCASVRKVVCGYGHNLHQSLFRCAMRA